MNYDEWYNGEIESLSDLFKCYMILQKKKLWVKNVGFSASNFFDDCNKSLCNDKIELYISKVVENHFDNDRDLYDIELKEIEALILKNDIDISSIISGKYLLFTLYHRIKGIISTNIKKESLMFRLVKVCELNSLNSLVDLISNVT